MMGHVTFTLDVRAQVSDDEIRNINKYKLGKTTLYSRGELADPGKGLLGAASRLAFKMTNISVSVDDLVRGKHLEFKDIVEMLSVIEQIKEAAQNFKAVLDAAAHFGGEEAIEV
jgi:hypothetical protein